MTEPNELAVREIVRLEDERCAAMLEGDAVTLDRLLHPNMVYMHSSGVADSKVSYLSGVRDGVWDYRRIDRSDQTIRVDGDIALVFNRLSISIIVRGVEKELDNRALAVWARRDGGWRLMGVQSGIAPKQTG